MLSDPTDGGRRGLPLASEGGTRTPLHPTKWLQCEGTSVTRWGGPRVTAQPTASGGRPGRHAVSSSSDPLGRGQASGAGLGQHMGVTASAHGHTNTLKSTVEVVAQLCKQSKNPGRHLQWTESTGVNDVPRGSGREAPSSTAQSGRRRPLSPMLRRTLSTVSGPHNHGPAPASG